MVAITIVQDKNINWLYFFIYDYQLLRTYLPT